MDCICSKFKPSSSNSSTTLPIAAESSSLCCVSRDIATYGALLNGVWSGTVNVCGDGPPWFNTTDYAGLLVELDNGDGGELRLQRVRKVPLPDFRSDDLTCCDVTVKWYTENVAPQFICKRLEGHHVTSFFGTRNLSPSKVNERLYDALTNYATFVSTGLETEVFFDTDFMRDNSTQRLVRLFGQIGTKPYMCVIFEEAAERVVMGKVEGSGEEEFWFYPRQTKINSKTLQIMLVETTTDTLPWKISMPYTEFTDDTRKCQAWSHADMWPGYDDGVLMGTRAVFWKRLSSNYAQNLDQPFIIFPNYVPRVMYAVSYRQFPFQVFDSSLNCEQVHHAIASVAMHWESVVIQRPTPPITSKMNSVDKVIIPVTDADFEYKKVGNDQLKCYGFFIDSAIDEGNVGVEPPLSVLFSNGAAASAFRMKPNVLTATTPVGPFKAHHLYDFCPQNVSELPNVLTVEESTVVERQDLKFPYWQFWSPFFKIVHYVIYIFVGRNVYVQIVTDKQRCKSEHLSRFGIPSKKNFISVARKRADILKLPPGLFETQPNIFFWYQKTPVVTDKEIL